jgi:hypothetical protein
MTVPIAVFAATGTVEGKLKLVVPCAPGELLSNMHPLVCASALPVGSRLSTNSKHNNPHQLMLWRLMRRRCERSRLMMVSEWQRLHPFS